MLLIRIPNLLTGLLCLLCFSLYSQTTTFQKSYMGLASANANDILETDDGYLIAGETSDTLLYSSDALLIHTDKNGTVLWKKTYGYSFGNDIFSKIIPANDGGFIAWGYATNYGQTKYDCWLVKLDNDGNVLWQQTIVVLNGYEYPVGKIIATPDGYVLSGTYLIHNQTFVVRVNNNGETIWSRITTMADDTVLGLQYMDDGLLYLMGKAKNLGCWRTMDLATGDIVQSREYQADDENLLNNAHSTPDGNHLMTGMFGNEDGGLARSAGWVQKVNAEGQIIWSKAYRINNRFNNITASTMLDDGSCILAMHCSPTDTSTFVTTALIKIDANGAVIWARNFGSANDYGYFFQLSQTEDGGFIAAGYSRNKIQPNYIAAFWLKTDSLGLLHDCCVSDFAVTVEDISPETLQEPFSSTPFENTGIDDVPLINTPIGEVQDFCFSTQLTINRTIAFYSGQTVILGDSIYSDSGVVTILLPSTTGGCDTLATYTLELLDSTNHQTATFLQKYKELGFDIANDVLETADGYLIAGRTQNAEDIGRVEALLIHINKSGALLWKKTYDHTSNISYGTINKIIAANDGEYLVLGSTWSYNFERGTWLAKIDNDGNLLWQKSIDISVGTNIIAIPDGYILSGATEANGGTHSFVTRVDNNGNTLWSRSMPSPVNNNLSVQYVSDSLLYLTGHILTIVHIVPNLFYSTTFACWKTMDMATGAIVQSQEYQVDSLNDMRTIHQTPEGNHIMTGSISSGESVTSQQNGWVQKVNSAGEVLWSKIYKIGDKNDIVASDMLADGSLILAMSVYSFIDSSIRGNALIKIDAQGAVVWARMFEGANGWTQVRQTADGGFLITGYKADGNDTSDANAFWMKTDSLGIVEGCCSANAIVTVQDVSPITLQSPLEEGDFGQTLPYNLAVAGPATGEIEDFCFNNQPTVNQTLTFYHNQSVTLGDSTYTQSTVVNITLPSTMGGCDTLATYTLELLDTTQHQTATFLQEYKGLLFDQANDVLETADGYLIAGATQNTDITHLEALLIHINKNGEVLWKKTYSHISQCVINRIIAANDGGYLLWGTISGSSFYEAGAWLAKIDNDGNLIWQRFLSMHTVGTNITAIPDGYILSGGTETNVGPHYYSFVTRVDNNGNTIWSRSMPSPVENTLSVQYVADSLLYLTGYIMSPPPFFRAFACWKTMDMATGTIVQSWEYQVDTFNNMYNMHRTPEGNHIMTGSISRGVSGSIPYNGWVQKVNSAGEVLWSKTYQIGDGILIYASEMLADGSLVLAMNSSSYTPDVVQPGALIKIDAQGAVVWARSFESLGSWTQIRQTDDGGFFITGYKPGSNSPSDGNAFWMKTDSLGIVADCCVANATVIVEDVSPTTLQLPFEEEDFENLLPYDVAVEGVAAEEVADFCFNTQPTIERTLAFCSGQSIALGDSTYSQPGVVTLSLPSTTGGCDTLATYTLELLEQITNNDTIVFCSGQTITLGDSTYSAPTTVNLIIPSSTGGCDTIATYTLEFSDSPVINQTITFCSGQTVTLGDSTYSAPTTVNLIIPSSTGGCDTIATYTLEFSDSPVINQTITFCSGQTVTLGDSTYSAPTTVNLIIPATNGGCDTVATYTLEFLDSPVVNRIITSCSGQTVTLGDSTYSVSTTVNLIIPASNGGCDTMATYTLEFLDLPTVSQTISFCPSETVTLGDSIYSQPGVITILIPSTTGGCDTVATYTLEYSTTNQPNSVQITCPANITTTVLPGANSLLVNYDLPTATSDCPCPGMLVDLTSGGANGSLFPLGTNTVCYRVEDACGNEKTCCFTVQIEEGAGCDEKINGCVTFELLTVQRDISQNWVYRVRIINNCSSEMTYAYIEVPNGVQAIHPTDNSTYFAPGGHTYTVRNPNFSPFYSLRFKPIAGGLVGGQSDVFRYVLPEQASVEYIHVAARLASGNYHEAYLNTFSCPIGTEYVSDGRMPSTDRNNIVDNEAISVFPNPAANGTTLSITGHSIPNGTFLLQDLMGRSVLKSQIVDNQIDMTQSNIAAGVYLFKIIADGQFVGSGKISLF